MEGMARLALVEQSVRDIDKFNNLLYELLRHINHILENPHDYQLRTVKSNILKDYMKLDALSEYLKYVGFEPREDIFVYPNKLTLSNLRMAQVAIERKITICCGTVDKSQVLKSSLSQPVVKNAIKPANILNTDNPFLLKIQDLFNMMLQYEDPQLLALARSQIPLVTLQLMALDRVREQQKKIKTGETKSQDLPFDIALLMELMSWFKYKFFTWMDSPQCACGGDAMPAGGTTRVSRGELCRIELYTCKVCGAAVTFPRYNNPRTLLEWRRGRCGEWANCFTLLCRALGYDVRYVYDVTDHVWCEVFDYDSGTWLHVDPCEGALNTPLMYSHGWGKQLSYVIAVSRDDAQDVTWRYDAPHDEVRKRRKQCTEWELIDCLVTLRAHRQSQVSSARCVYLAKRTLCELVHLMTERKPEETESHGRISGAAAWRRERAECGPGIEPHVFRLAQRGTYSIRYICACDRYRVSRDGEEIEAPATWARGVSHVQGVTRKVEQDWKQAYLAREEGCDVGEISWQFTVASGLVCDAMSVALTSAVYEDGKVQWTVAFDGDDPMPAELGESLTDFSRLFVTVTLRAALRAGSGPLAWQHAQLFRQPLHAESPAFTVTLHVQ